MFPIPYDQPLSLLQIADYWSRETHPIASIRETLIVLIKAFWRCEVSGTNEPSRLQALRSLFLHHSDHIAFVAPEKELPVQNQLTADGGFIAVRPVAVPVPNLQPASWTDQSCLGAYEELAEGWELLHDDTDDLLIYGNELTRAEFFEWVQKRGSLLPKFWGESTAQDGLLTEGKPHLPTFRPAQDARIREAICAVYDKADDENSKAPNIKQLPAQVRQMLQAEGFDASGKHIQELGQAPEFARRRRKPGKTVASERRCRARPA